MLVGLCTRHPRSDSLHALLYKDSLPAALYQFFSNVPLSLSGRFPEE